MTKPECRSTTSTKARADVRIRSNMAVEVGGLSEMGKVLQLLLGVTSIVKNFQNRKCSPPGAGIEGIM